MRIQSPVAACDPAGGDRGTVRGVSKGPFGLAENTFLWAEVRHWGWVGCFGVGQIGSSRRLAVLGWVRDR